MARRTRECGPGARVRRRAQEGGAPPRSAALRAVRPRAVRGRLSSGALRRDAPASGVHANPARGPPWSGSGRGVAPPRGGAVRLAPRVRPVGGLVADGGLLFHNAWITLVEVVLGLAIAVAAGTAAAVGMHLVRPLREAAYPLLI